MTQDEYTQAKQKGQVQTEQAAETGPDVPTNPDEAFTIEDFLPQLVSILATRRHITAAPTFTPKTFLDAIQFYDDGVNRRLYLYLNKAWRYCTLT